MYDSGRYHNKRKKSAKVISAMLREICQSLISYLFRLDITILDKTEAKRINHENTKVGKHEKFIFFRVFVISCFRDKKVLFIKCNEFTTKTLICVQNSPHRAN